MCRRAGVILRQINEVSCGFREIPSKDPESLRDRFSGVGVRWKNKRPGLNGGPQFEAMNLQPNICSLGGKEKRQPPIIKSALRGPQWHRGPRPEHRFRIKMKDEFVPGPRRLGCSSVPKSFKIGGKSPHA